MNPSFAYNWESTHQAAALQLEYADLASGEDVDIPVSIAGHIIARRVMGKLGFERIRAKVRRNPNSAHIRPRLSCINLATK
jgi:lysyl-tRNA synthetase, class II